MGIHMERLAVLGGTPVRETPIFYGRQCIEDDDIEAVVRTLKSDLITCGPRVEELERSCARSQGPDMRWWLRTVRLRGTWLL